MSYHKTMNSQTKEQRKQTRGGGATRSLFSLLATAGVLTLVFALLSVGPLAGTAAADPGTPTVDGLYSGDEANYVVLGSADGGRGTLYYNRVGDTLYLLMRVAPTVNDNVFASRDETAYLASAGWSKQHKFKNLLNSDHVQLSVQCGGNSWNWRQDYLYDTDGDKDPLENDWLSDPAGPDGGGTPPPGLVSASSLQWNMNGAFDITGDGTRTSDKTYKSPDPISNYPGFDATSPWEWAMVYEMSMDISDCGDNAITIAVPSAHNSPSKDGNSDVPIPPTLLAAAIGNFVWEDSDADGIQDAGEPGISGVTVKLYNSGHTLISTTTTDGNGNYSFTGLTPGDYYLEFVPPAGYTFSPQDQGGDDALDSDADTTTGKTIVTNLVAGENDTSWDAGLYRPASIGDRVWSDENGDGQQTGTFDQTGFNGVTVRLYRDADEDLIFEPGADDGPALATTTTAAGTSQTPPNFADGIYNFDMALLQLGPGSYWVQVDTSTLPSTNTWAATTANPQWVQFTGTNDYSIDFGFVATGVPTFIQLGFFQATAVGGGVRFEWQTATELLNAGFNLYVQGQGGRVKLNKELIPSQVISSLEPTDYAYTAYGVSGDRFFIEDVEVTGETRVHGPFELGQAYGTRSQPQATDWEAVRKEHEGKAQSVRDGLKGAEAALQGNGSAGPWKVFVNQDGIYRLTHEYLLTQGVDLTGVKGSDIALLNRGKPVQIYVSTDKRFGSGDYIEFVGQALDTLYTDTNVYWLKVDRRQALRVAIDTRPPDRNATPPGYFMDTLVMDEDRGYMWIFPADYDGDPWYSTQLFARGGPAFAELTFSLDDLTESSGDFVLAMEMWGATSFDQNPDHHVVVQLNGETVFDGSFDGWASFRPVGAFPVTLLRSGLNALTISVPGDTGALYDMVYLDNYQITYPRRFRAVSDRLHIQAERPASAYRADGFSSDQVVIYQVASDGKITRIEGYQVEQGNDGLYSVTFRSSARGAASYLVTTAAAALTALTAQANLPTGIKDGSAEYLIVAHPDFLQDIQPLANYHTGRGLTVKVVDVTSVYDEFNYGIFDAAAIDAYVTYAQQRLGTRFVLLVGDDTSDYRDNLGQGSFSHIPSIYVRSIYNTDYRVLAPSDNAYADVNGDEAPDLAIGRLPVRTGAELAAVVDKIVNFEANSVGYSTRAVFAADDDDPFFANSSESLISLLPVGFEVQRAYLGQIGLAASQQILLSAINSGTLLVNYVGHSGGVGWTAEGLLRREDVVGKLTNAGQPTVIAQWGCWTGYYSLPDFTTISEVLLNTANKGAATVLASTNMALPGPQIELAERVYDYLFGQGLTLGEALQRAKADLVALNPESARNVVIGWIILGDPALGF